MANGWTLERREKQSQLIREWKPWQQSIGPVSKEGKAVSAKNALKHGCRSREWLEQMQNIREIIRESREIMERS